VPTILRAGPYRFFFWSNDRTEPAHVHVASGDEYAKFWLAPVRLAKNEGYNSRQLRRVRQLIEQHRKEFLERWYDHFRSR
jgi:hypothetical protein